MVTKTRSTGPDLARLFSSPSFRLRTAADALAALHLLCHTTAVASAPSLVRAPMYRLQSGSVERRHWHHFFPSSASARTSFIALHSFLHRHWNLT
jgi:hypothetical protein